jgi:hypothetical protein
MSRTLPTGYAALTEGKVFRPVFLMFLDWPADPVYAWTGYGSITFDGHTWVGVGTYGAISQIAESKDIRANGISLTVSGIPSDLVAKALADDTSGASGKVYMASLANDGTFAADPYLIFDGFIDVVPMEDSGETSTLTVQLEKELIDRRFNDRRNTHEDQQIDYAGDMFFEFVAGLVDKQITWGGVTVAGSNAAPAAATTSSKAAWLGTDNFDQGDAL